MEDKKEKLRQLLTTEFGKVPPQDINIEVAVLGAILAASKDAFPVMDLLFEEIFYKEQHVLIFRAITNLFARSEAIDILTVSKELNSMGELETVGGPMYVSGLTDKVASAANIETHILYLEQMFRKRDMIRISGALNTDSYSNTSDPDEILYKATQELLLLATSGFQNRAIPTSKLADNVKAELKAIRSGEIEDNRINTLFYKLDHLMNGWRPGDLIIIASRPGMGKTALMVSIAHNIGVKSKIPIAVFSLEMTNRQIMIRLAAVDSGLSYKRIEGVQYTDEEEIVIDNAFDTIKDSKIYIDDTPAIDLIELRSKVLQFVSKYGIKIIMIDYLQLMTVKDGRNGREREVATISAGLKSLAKSVKIPVVAFSQLNRDCESRKPQIPRISDLRESGSLEQDSDAVIFLYRDEYYGYENFIGGDPKYEGMSTENTARIIVAKHRNGATGSILTGFQKTIMRFDNEFRDTDENGVEYPEDGNEPF